MKKYLLLVSILAFYQPALSADISALKLDAAKRAFCSQNYPCSINSKGHESTFVVKVTRVTITEDGVININHHDFQRFIYDTTGKYLNEIK